MNANDYKPVVDEQLKLAASATFTATGNVTAIDLGAGSAPGGGGIPMQAAVKSTALDLSSGNETYTFRLEDSPDNSTFTARTPDVAMTAVGVILLQGYIAQRYVRLVRTLGGTTPSVTIADVYLSPDD